MKNGRKARTRSDGGAKRSGGQLQVDKNGHVTPGFLGGEGAPATWEARTGYTKENRVGASSKGTTINLPGKG